MADGSNGAGRIRSQRGGHTPQAVVVDRLVKLQEDKLKRPDNSITAIMNIPDIDSCAWDNVLAYITHLENEVKETEAMKSLCIELLSAANKCSEAPHYIVQPFMGI